MKTRIWEQNSSKATPSLHYSQKNNALGLAPCAQVEEFSPTPGAGDSQLCVGDTKPQQLKDCRQVPLPCQSDLVPSSLPGCPKCWSLVGFTRIRVGAQGKRGREPQTSHHGHEPHEDPSAWLLESICGLMKPPVTYQ